VIEQTSLASPAPLTGCFAGALRLHRATNTANLESVQPRCTT